jgi:hypothetical protein
LLPSGGGHAIGHAEGSRTLGDGRCAVISGARISVTAEIRAQMRRRRKSRSSAAICNILALADAVWRSEYAVARGQQVIRIVAELGLAARLSGHQQRSIGDQSNVTAVT